MNSSLNITENSMTSLLLTYKHMRKSACNQDEGLAFSLSVLEGRAAKSAVCLALMSEMDPAEETEADTSSERPGLDSPELEPMKQDFCRGEELRRCNMTPECDDKLRASLQPARMSWK